jgi:hypothetical protein
MPEGNEIKPMKGPVTFTGMTEDDYTKAGSKFVNAAGTYKAELGLPGWWNEPRTIAFPITIISEGDQEGKSGNFIVGTDAKSAWKIKEITKAAKVELKMVKGHPVFNPSDFVGKVIQTVWALDERPEVSGKNIYKPTTALSMATESEVIQ